MFDIAKGKVHVFEGKHDSMKEMYLSKMLRNFDQVIYLACNRSALNSIQRLIENGLSAELIATRFQFVDCVSNHVGLKQSRATENITYCDNTLNNISIALSSMLDKNPTVEESIVVFDNLSVLYLYHMDAFQQFMHSLTERLRQWGGSAVYLLDADTLELRFERMIETLVDVVAHFNLEGDELVIQIGLEKTSEPVADIAPSRHLPEPVSAVPSAFFTERLNYGKQRIGMGRNINLFWTQLVNFASLLIDNNLPLHIYSSTKKNSRELHFSIIEQYGFVGRGWKIKGFDVDAIAAIFTGKGAMQYGESVLEFNVDKSNKDNLFFREYDCLDCWQLSNNMNSMICWAASGMAAGAVEALSGVHVESIETACKANGDSHCEFSIRDYSEGNIIDYYNDHVRRFKVADAILCLTKIVECYFVKGEPPVQREKLGVTHDLIGLQLRTSIPCSGNENCSKWLFEGAKLVSKRVYSQLADAGVEHPNEVMLSFIDQAGVGKVNHNEDFAKITVDGSAESFGLSTSKPSCNFLGGYISGIIEEQLNKPVEYIETTCIAANGHHCVFERI